MLETVLCIDDDPITLMLCKKVIAKAEFSKETLTAKNGEEALQYFNNLKYTNTPSNKKNTPEIIFLDLNMPVMGGWEFLDHFIESHYNDFNKNTKIIILSSTINPEDLEKAKKYKIVVDFLSKPINQDMLKYITEKG